MFFRRFLQQLTVLEHVFARPLVARFSIFFVVRPYLRLPLFQASHRKLLTEAEASSLLPSVGELRALSTTTRDILAAYIQDPESKNLVEVLTSAIMPSLP